LTRLQRDAKEEGTEIDRNKNNLGLCYIGKKLPHSNSLALSGREEHQLDKRDKSSLHLRDIIKFVSSSLLKTFAFLHFRIFQRTQVMTVLLILGHRSMRGFTIHNCSTPRAYEIRKHSCFKLQQQEKTGTSLACSSVCLLVDLQNEKLRL